MRTQHPIPDKRGRAFSEIACFTLTFGLAFGILFGLLHAWRYGFGSLVSVSVHLLRHQILVNLAFSILFVLLLGVLVFVFSSLILKKKFGAPLISGIALAPFALNAAYRINADFLPGIRTAKSLIGNGILLLGFVLVWLLVSLAVRSWAGKRLTGDGNSTVPYLSDRRTLGILVVVFLVSIALPFVLNQSKRVEGNQVFFLLIDALRADHVGCYGYDRDTTPNLDRLAEDGVRFEQTISQSTFTKTSIASVFTSRFPYEHKVYWGNSQDTEDKITSDVLSEEEFTLAERLLEAGFLTEAWIRNAHLSAFMGFGQGFVEYREDQGSAGSIHDLVMEWIDGRGKDFKFFSYIHYLDLHDPYTPKPPYDTMYGSYSNFYEKIDFSRWGAYLSDIREGKITLRREEVDQLISFYDGLITYIDEEIGRFLNALKERGLYDNAMIIVTADHGDGFMEHDFISHSTLPYDELLKVPLIVKFPKSEWKGRTVERQVRLIDVMPTILEYVGAEMNGGMDGVSLLPLLDGSEDVGAVDFPEYAVSEIAVEGSYPVSSVRTETFKHIHFQQRQDEFYNLKNDPGEKHNIIHRESERAAVFHQIQMDIVACRAQKNTRDKVTLDEKTIEKLKSMGYIK